MADDSAIGINLDGVMGLLTRRRKRKAAAALAA
jgi:hypothetical protein